MILAITVHFQLENLTMLFGLTSRSWFIKAILKNAFINEGSRELVLPELDPDIPVAPAAPVATNTEYIPLQTYVVKAPTRPVGRMVSCPFRGANNTIYGASGECEYCGSPLEWDLQNKASLSDALFCFPE